MKNHRPGVFNNNFKWEWMRAIKSDRRGQSRLLKIRPDGYITFPVVGDAITAGKRLPKLAEVATLKYQEKVENYVNRLVPRFFRTGANFVYDLND